MNSSQLINLKDVKAMINQGLTKGFITKQEVDFLKAVWALQKEFDDFSKQFNHGSYVESWDQEWFKKVNEMQSDLQGHERRQRQGAKNQNESKIFKAMEGMNRWINGFSNVEKTYQDLVKNVASYWSHDYDHKEEAQENDSKMKQWRKSRENWMESEWNALNGVQGADGLNIRAWTQALLHMIEWGAGIHWWNALDEKDKQTARPWLREQWMRGWPSRDTAEVQEVLAALISCEEMAWALEVKRILCSSIEEEMKSLHSLTQEDPQKNGGFKKSQWEAWMKWGEKVQSWNIHWNQNHWKREWGGKSVKKSIEKVKLLQDKWAWFMLDDKSLKSFWDQDTQHWYWRQCLSAPLMIKELNCSRDHTKVMSKDWIKTWGDLWTKQEWSEGEIKEVKKIGSQLQPLNLEWFFQWMEVNMKAKVHWSNENPWSLIMKHGAWSDKNLKKAKTLWNQWEAMGGDIVETPTHWEWKKTPSFEKIQPQSLCHEWIVSLSTGANQAQRIKAEDIFLQGLGVRMQKKPLDLNAYDNGNLTLLGRLNELFKKYPKNEDIWMRWFENIVDWGGDPNQIGKRKSLEKSATTEIKEAIATAREQEILWNSMSTSDQEKIKQYMDFLEQEKIKKTVVEQEQDQGCGRPKKTPKRL